MRFCTISCHPTPLPACCPSPCAGLGWEHSVVLVLSTRRVYDQREKYPAEEDLNQHSPGKPQRTNAASTECPEQAGLLEQAGLQGWQTHRTVRMEAPS